MAHKRKRLTVEDYLSGIIAGNRAILSRAITLTESTLARDQENAEELMNRIVSRVGKSTRVGITGLPGVGKSTLLDELGIRLLKKGHKIAVLAIDPSSSVGGGSILGDKTRMSRLASEASAYIRPSPNGATSGGIARRTREALLLCEAAGFDIIFVETVGVGQAEVKVADMVDCVVAMMLPGGGDELQGIKKGILELADIIVVNKADGDNAALARRTLADHKAALRYLRPKYPEWSAKALSLSGLQGIGVEELWDTIVEHRQMLMVTGRITSLRSLQRQRWMWSTIEDALMMRFQSSPEVRSSLPKLEAALLRGDVSARSVAKQLLGEFLTNEKQ